MTTTIYVSEWVNAFMCNKLSLSYEELMMWDKGCSRTFVQCTPFPGVSDYHDNREVNLIGSKWIY